MVFPGRQAVVFVHGCFWHRHTGCAYTTPPSIRPDFLARKFAGNVARDARVMADLSCAGWRVAVVWGCALRKSDAEETALTVAQWLVSGVTTLEVP